VGQGGDAGVTYRGWRHPRSTLAEAWEARALIFELTRGKLRGQYKRTALGQGWSLLNPLAQIGIYTLMFSVILRVHSQVGDPSGLDVFALWLASAMLPWLYLGQVLNSSTGVLVGNAPLIQRVYFPRIALVVANELSLLTTFTTGIMVLHVAILIAGGNPFPYLPATLFLMLAISIFALGLSLVLAVVNVYIRDVPYIMSLVMMLWLYGTPIIYPIEVLTDSNRLSDTGLFLYRLNPMVRLTESFRDVLFDNRWPSFSNLLYVTTVSALVLCFGFVAFRRFDGRIAADV
jgi:ABC-2 type transport system permease protein